MDSLFHFILSLAGGFIFLELLKVKYRPWHLVLLSFSSLSIDIQHLLAAFYRPIVLHAFYFALLPLVPAVYFYSANKAKPFLYSIALSLMFFGHLFADMITGMYGVPLFYPFSERLFMLPMGYFYFGTSPIISSAGIAMALYFALIYLAYKAVSCLSLK